MSQPVYGFLYDFVFKYVFGRQQNAELLSYLLNALLERPKENKITVTEITNPFNLKEFAEDKFSIVATLSQLSIKSIHTTHHASKYASSAANSVKIERFSILKTPQFCHIQPNHAFH